MNISSVLNQIILFLVLVHIIFGIALFILQKSFIYYPNTQDISSCSLFSEYTYVVENQTRLYYKEGSSTQVIVFYHGNAGTVCDRGYVKDLLEQTNHSIIFVEYTGFGQGSGNPSKNALLQNVRDTVAFIDSKHITSVTILGESLGTGPASYHTTIQDVQNILLVTPFSSIVDVARNAYSIYPVSLLIHQNFDNVQWLKDFQGNVSLFHGDTDTIIPHALSEKLYVNIISKNKNYFLYEREGHNNLWNNGKFKKDILSKLE